MIHVILHFKTVNAKAVGKRVREVACEKCGERFCYELVREAKGQASSLYGMFPESTRARAQAVADKALAKRLEKDVELVPCPGCRWVNEADIRRFRKSRYREWSQVAWFVVIVGAILDLLLYFMAQDFFGRAPSIWALELWVVMGITAGLAAGLFAVQYGLRGRIDPNVMDAQGRQRLPAGTPPALRAAMDARGQQVYVAVAREFPAEVEELWAVYRPGQLVLEWLCCECLEPAARRFTLPGASFLEVPVCQACHRRLRGRWMLKLVVVVLAAAFLGVMAGWAMGPELYALMGVLAFVAAVIGIGYVQQTSKPFRLQAVDKQRGIERIAFRNPAYTALLIRRIGEAEGAFPQEVPR